MKNDKMKGLFFILIFIVAVIIFITQVTKPGDKDDDKSSKSKSKFESTDYDRDEVWEEAYNFGWEFMMIFAEYEADEYDNFDEMYADAFNSLSSIQEHTVADYGLDGYESVEIDFLMKGTTAQECVKSVVDGDHNSKWHQLVEDNDDSGNIWVCVDLGLGSAMAMLEEEIAKFDEEHELGHDYLTVSEYARDIYEIDTDERKKYTLGMDTYENFVDTYPIGQDSKSIKKWLKK